MENYNLKNGLAKMKRTDLADGALTWARQAYLKNGPTDSITVTNLIRLTDMLYEVRTPDMTAEEWNAVRRYYVKRALGGDVDE